MDDELKLSKAVIDGSFELICTEMQLLRCPGYHDSLLDGTGVIRSNKDGTLSFQMVAPRTGVPELVRRERRQHGELTGKHDLVMLRAVDHFGQEWRSNWLLPEVKLLSSQSGNWMVRHNLHSIARPAHRPLKEESEIRLYIPQIKHLPFDMATITKKTAGEKQLETGSSLDHHIRRIGSVDVEFRQRDRHWLEVRARKQSSLMPDWPGQLCQALSFATAKTIRPVYLIREFQQSIYAGNRIGTISSFRLAFDPAAGQSMVEDRRRLLVNCAAIHGMG